MRFIRILGLGLLSFLLAILGIQAGVPSKFAVAIAIGFMWVSIILFGTEKSSLQGTAPRPASTLDHNPQKADLLSTVTIDSYENKGSCSTLVVAKESAGMIPHPSKIRMETNNGRTVASVEVGSANQG